MRSRFQPTLPARGATSYVRIGDSSMIFQPTLPARGATEVTLTSKWKCIISTHAPRTGSDALPWVIRSSPSPISTHAPRTGSDTMRGFGQGVLEISTHAPRTGSDESAFKLAASGVTFQPTLPARGATTGTPSSPAMCAHFNPRSPHGERRGQIPSRCSSAGHFNPRSPHGERRAADDQRVATVGISTHAPRTGSDFIGCPVCIGQPNFNPRSPHGERLDTATGSVCVETFQPTLPARGATLRRTVTPPEQ